jgi:hypothetical protein
MKWSNLFLLTAVASGVAPAVAPVTLADAPAADDGQVIAITTPNDPDAERKAVPFIGIVTSPLGEQVRAQTNIGLSVVSVAPDSPAAKAGLKVHDILAKYDDQILCAAVQLSALVKRTGTGNKATLTVLRGGKEMPIKVTIGEHAAQAMITAQGLNFDAGQQLDPAVLKLLEQQLEQQHLKLFGGPGVGGQAQYYDDRLPTIPPVGPPNATPAQPQIPRNQRWHLLVNPNIQSQTLTLFADNEGRVEIRETNGKRTVTVLDTAGEPQYTGPLDSPEDREKIPAELRGRVEQAEASAGPGGPREPVLPPLNAPLEDVPDNETESGDSL